MTDENKMAVVENIRTSNRGYEFTCEYRNFPVTFVNALRRIILHGIPTVVIRDVQILENTTQIPHEMLRHRVEMLPVNVNPEDSAAIREAKIELRILPQKDGDTRMITTDDFVVESNRGKILMRDRDFDMPILFLRVKPGETVHIKGRLSVETQDVSQVSVATTMWHVDPELSKKDREKWVEDGKDPIAFDNFYYQMSYSRDPETGRPNCIDMMIESIGVLPAKEILGYAVRILKKRVQDYMKDALENIAREKEEGAYRVAMNQGGHTIGALFQELIYNDMNADFGSYDIPHPLRNEMILRFLTKKSPESVLRTAAQTIEEYCSTVEKVL
jgi:DNA-directed RNA polymerase subunit L